MSTEQVPVVNPPPDPVSDPDGYTEYAVRYGAPLIEHRAAYQWERVTVEVTPEPQSEGRRESENAG